MKKVEINEDIVHHVANLARLEVAHDKVQEVKQHMQNFLNHVTDLSKVDTTGIKPFFSPASEHLDLYTTNTILREDVVEESLTPAELLKNAPKQTANQFRVDAVIEDAE